MHLDHHDGAVAAPGQDAAVESETPARAGLAFQGEGQDRGQADSAADDGAAQITAGIKEKINVVACAALVGVEMYELAGGGFLLVRCGYSLRVADLDAVRAALARLGAPS